MTAAAAVSPMKGAGAILGSPTGRGSVARQSIQEGTIRHQHYASTLRRAAISLQTQAEGASGTRQTTARAWSPAQQGWAAARRRLSSLHFTHLHRAVMARSRHRVVRRARASTTSRHLTITSGEGGICSAQFRPVDLSSRHSFGILHAWMVCLGVGCAVNRGTCLL